MTNKEKAKELYKKWCNSETDGCVGDLLLDMAKWKDAHPSKELLKKIFELQDKFEQHCSFKDNCVTFTEKECLECKVNWFFNKLNEKK